MTNFLHLIGAQFRETILIQQKVNHACTSALPAEELVFGRAYYCSCSNQKTQVPWVMSNTGIQISFQYHSILVGFNPLEKAWVKLDHFSKFRSRKIEKKSLINHHTGNVTFKWRQSPSNILGMAVWDLPGFLLRWPKPTRSMILAKSASASGDLNHNSSGNEAREVEKDTSVSLGQGDGKGYRIWYCWWFRNPKQPPGMYQTL